MTKKNILIIDDDKELVELLSQYLQSEGFNTSACYDGLSGLEKAQQEGVDLILLDVMMPELNGFDVLRALGGHSKIPIMMLTARGDENDRVLGLELGADDYLAKPFKHRELLARIRAIFRRIEIINQPNQTKVTELNYVKLNHATREVFCHEQSVDLTGTEYQILHFLMENAGNIVSKQQISEQVLARELSLYDRSIDMHISNIRRKLLACDKSEKFKTIRGAGYIFLLRLD
jgi:two-component system response regulator CpxR